MPQTKTRTRRITKEVKQGHATGRVTIGKATMLGEVLTLDEAARYLRVSPQEVDHLATRGDLPAKKIGEQWRFSRSAITAWLGEPARKNFWDVHAGALKDDPYRDEMLREIYRQRGRPMTEDE